MEPSVLASGILTSVPFTQRASASVLATELPESYLSDALIQGQQGDDVSFAFAAVTALNLASIQFLGKPLDFSANHIRYALSNDGKNTLGFSRSYVSEASRAMVTAYLTRAELGGPVSAFLDPYVPGTGKDSTISPARDYEETAKFTRAVAVTGIEYIPDLGFDDELAKIIYIKRIQKAILAHGSVVASLYMEKGNPPLDPYLQTEHHAVNRSVAVVGWDNESRSFSVIDSAGNLGAGSQYQVSYDTRLSDAYSISALEEEIPYTYDTAPFSLTDATGFSSNSAYFANVFTVSTAAEVLRSISFFAMGENTTYQVYVSSVSPEESAQDALSAAIESGPLVLSSGATVGVAALPGYITATLSEPLNIGSEGDRFAVVVRAESPSTLSPIPLQTGALGAELPWDISWISPDGLTWSDIREKQDATVILQAHVEQNVTIPLVDFSLTSNDKKNIGGVSYPVFRTSPGQKTYMGPRLNPTNATDIEYVEWAIGDSQGTPDSFNASLSEEDSIDPSGVYTARQLGEKSLRCSILLKDGRTLTQMVLIAVEDVDVTAIVLDISEATLKTNEKLTLTASVEPAEATIPIEWKIAKNEFYDPYEIPFDDANPFQEGAPIAQISEEGVLTPYSPGVCYVYAQSVSGWILSTPCKVTITEIELQGLRLAKKKITIPLGTKYTLPAKTVPENASYQDFKFVSLNEHVLRIDPIHGILETVGEGVCTVEVIAHNGITARCEITVTGQPSKILKIGAGFAPVYTPLYPELPVQMHFTSSLSLSDKNFIISDTSKKVRIIGQSVGSSVFRVFQEAEYGIDDWGNPIKLVVWEQTFTLECVTTTPKLKLIQDDGVPAKKITLCVQAGSLIGGESLSLLAVSKNEEATLLRFVWKVRNPEILQITPDPLDPLGQRVKITALRPGTTKLTAMNYNGNRRVSITVRVLYAPTGITLVQGPEQQVKSGSKLRFKAILEGDKVSKTVLYQVEDSGDNLRAHTPEDPIAIIEASTLKLLRAGSVKVTAIASPFDEKAVRTTILVTSIVPLKKLTIDEKAVQLGTKETHNVSFIPSPENTTQLDWIVYSNAPLIANASIVDGEIQIVGVSPGKAKITLTSGENPNKRATILVYVD
jgi:C1A family cysteine protease